MEQGQQPNYIGKVRHPSLPQGLGADALAEWLRSNAVDSFTDTKKAFLKPEELSNYEHESVVAGREINRLNDALIQVRDHVKKGSDEPLKLEIPATEWTKTLETIRRENDDLVETGYVSEKVEIFGIPNEDTAEMEYFTVSGEIIPDRTRALSPSEKHKYLGMFQDNTQADQKDGTNS